MKTLREQFREIRDSMREDLAVQDVLPPVTDPDRLSTIKGAREQVRALDFADQFLDTLLGAEDSSVPRLLELIRQLDALPHQRARVIGERFRMFLGALGIEAPPPEPSERVN